MTKDTTAKSNKACRMRNIFHFAQIRDDGNGDEGAIPRKTEKFRLVCAVCCVVAMGLQRLKTNALCAMLVVRMRHRRA